MSDRLPTGLLVNALIRLVEQAGGHAMVLARGDRGSGTVLLLAVERDGSAQLWERDFGGGMARVGPTDGDNMAIADYWMRRRRNDPDLWVVEASVAAAERFAAETIFAD